MIKLFIFLGFVSSFSIFLILQPADACNEAVCASIVSKCLITQACKCDLQNCTCCKDCFSCLNTLYTECCSCVEMCPKPNSTKSLLSRQSHVEDFPDPVPSLFQSLVAEPDSLDRWLTLTYPVDFLKVDATKTTPIVANEQEVFVDRTGMVTLNCSVAYMSQCMPWTKCRASCQSMGAHSYRWFHDGCCECIGERCVNYGISESKCLHCPEKGASPPAEQKTYGENDDEVP